MNKKVNLLPESRQHKQNQKRVRRLTLIVAGVICAVAVAVPLLLSIIKGSQALLLKRTQAQIDERRQTIIATPNIITMLSAKDHLRSLPSLYAERLLVTRLLTTLPSVTPLEIRFSDIEIDSAGTIILKGASPTYDGVEKLYRALQRANVTYDANRVEIDPNTVGLFTGVVVEEVSGPSASEVSFTIRASFDLNLIASGGNNESQN